MKDTDYAYCVARIRAVETSLLTNDFIQKLVECNSYSETVHLLSEKGWMDENESVDEAVKKQNLNLWQLLSESVPDKKELEKLCVVNDYFNIKTAVKCALSEADADKFYIHPTSIDLVELTENIKTLSFNVIDKKYSYCAKEAFETANKTEIGQNADIIIDKAALEALTAFAQKSKNKIYSSICAFLSDSSNIKIALRCSATKKNSDFVSTAISECNKIDREKLIKYSAEDEQALYDYLLKTEYSDGVELYKKNTAAFDKWCDECIIKIAHDAKYTCFGFDPVCAYYYTKLNEIKTVRIILSSKLSGVDSDLIRERVRVLYV